MDDPLRRSAQHGPHEERPTPQPRTHDEAVAEGKCSEDYDPDASEAGHPRSRSGINGSSPFAYLPLFNIIRDVCPDMMHIIVNLFKHWLPLLSGERNPKKSKKFNRPAEPKPPDEKKMTPARYATQVKAYERAVEQFKVAEQKYEREKKRLRKAQEVCAEWALTTRDKQIVDIRMKDLSGCPKYIKPSHSIFKTQDGSKHAKAADWYIHTHTFENFMLTLC
jgi:hypothetical protein